MKLVAKYLGVMGLAALALGLFVSLSGIPFAPIWTLALPVGVISLGFSAIVFVLESELARPEEEERDKTEPVKPGPPREERRQQPERAATTSLSQRY